MLLWTGPYTVLLRVEVFIIRVILCVILLKSLILVKLQRGLKVLSQKHDNVKYKVQRDKLHDMHKLMMKNSVDGGRRH